MNDIVVPPRCSLIAMFALDTASPHERTCVIVNPDSQLLLKKNIAMPSRLAAIFDGMVQLWLKNTSFQPQFHPWEARVAAINA